MSAAAGFPTNGGAELSGGRATRLLAAVRPFEWSVRRELWEHRVIYLAPLGAGAVFLVGFLISLITLPHRMRAALAMQREMEMRSAVSVSFDFASGLLMITTLLVAAFYCLDALYGERRDRSLLFWKSMPVSDLTAVLAKAAVPIVILQLLAFGVTFLLHCIMLALSSVVLAANGMSVSAMWTEVSLGRLSLGLFYHLMVLHGLVFAPFYCWFLLVSSWARRAPLLWAVLPPLAIGIAEKVAFGTSYFAHMMGGRFSGGDKGWSASANNLAMDPSMHMTTGSVLLEPGFWAGLLFAAGFLVLAARMRRFREPG